MAFIKKTSQKYLLKWQQLDIRTQKWLLTSGVSFFSKGISLGVLIFSVPLTLDYLGKEKYGFLTTLVSTLAVITYADLGIGMGLQNKLPGLIAEEKKDLITKYISTTFYFLAIVSAFCLCLAIAGYFLIDWTTFFSTSGLNKEEVSLSVLVLLCSMVLAIPAAIIQRIQSAYQEGYISEIWISIGNVFSLAALCFVIYNKSGIPFIIASMQGVVSIFFILNFLFSTFVSKRYPNPSIRHFESSYLKYLISFGLGFLLLQISSLMVNSLDFYLISKYCGATQVTDYSIGFRLVSIISMPVQLLALPMLAAFNDAWARDDVKWVKKQLRIFFLTVVMLSVFSFIGIVFFGNTIIYYWTGTPQFNLFQLISFGVLLVYMNINFPLSMLGMSTRFFKMILIVYPIAAVLSFVIKYICLSFYQMEYIAVVWVTFVVLSIFFFMPLLYKIKGIKN